MKVGVCAWCLPVSEIESFKLASELGLEGVVINYGEMEGCPSIFTKEGREAYLIEARKYKMAIPTLAINPFCNLAITKEENEEEVKAILVDAINIAKEMGIAKLQIPSFVASFITSESDLNQTIKILDYACGIVKDKGIQIGTENVMTLDQYKKLYKSVKADALTTLYDTKNPWSMLSQDGVKIAEYVLPYVGELHAKDAHDEGADTLRLGEGSCKFNEIMTLFADAGFDAWIHLESKYPSMEDYKQVIADDIKILSEMFSGR